MRGTLISAAVRERATGIIPACAGNTSLSSPRRRVARDHPRMCGEHFKHNGVVKKLLGSSPHVRRTRRPGPCCGIPSGIIPACAGNTRPQRSASNRRRDHPRMCGEHRHRTLLPDRRIGSSPHVRGTRVPVTMFDAVIGIIPACAGNTE